MVDGLVDVAASDALLERYRRGGTGTSATVRSGDTPEAIAATIMATSGREWSMDEARRIKESYLALLNQLEYDEKSGAVVSASEVAALVGAEYAQVRTKLLAIPAEQAPRLHRLKTVPELQDALMGIMVEALEGLTRDGVPAAV